MKNIVCIFHHSSIKLVTAWIRAIEVFGIHIPLQKTLQNFLEIPGLFEEICNYEAELDNEKVRISNIMQANLWQTKYKNIDKYLFPLFIYYDDFQPGNSLGTHTSHQQIGGAYVMLPFLLPHLVAKLNNIFLGSIFYTKDRKQFGNLAVFQEIIKNINILSSKGIVINVNGSKQ